MIARVACAALQGVDATRVDLEVDFARQGMPAFTLVGLAEGAVREARERVMAALRAVGLRLPPARITVNLAPADRRKGGSGYDLPLAVALLEAAGIIPEGSTRGWFFAGELSLAGELKPVPGILPVAILARDEAARAAAGQPPKAHPEGVSSCARQTDAQPAGVRPADTRSATAGHDGTIRGIIVPKVNAAEAAVVDGIAAYGASTLGEVVAFLAGEGDLVRAVPPGMAQGAGGVHLYDFAEVKGQEHAKRAIEIAAAGAHNLLFIGPPGSGKTMLAQRIPSVLPPLTPADALEVTKVYSVAGLLDAGQGLVSQRPFRAPHHTVSEVGLAGGGAYPRPGEVSLAHRGVLFLDELPEFRKTALEVLRQPLEDGVVTISRAMQTLTYPADCMLVAAMNPCPCGYATDATHACTCSTMQVQRYHARLSGPLLDRIDLHVEVPAVPWEDLRSVKGGTSSAEMRERIMAARAVQTARFAGTHCRTNADLGGALLEEHCRLGTPEHTFLGKAVHSLALSARAYTRILRIARTIADLDGSEPLQVRHLAEAINCRVLDRERM